MPWHVAKTEQCPVSKPFGVIKDATGSVVPGGCHETQEKARKHMAALYASEQDSSRTGVSMARGAPWRTARRMYDLQQDHNQWYRLFRNQTSGPTQLHIFDEIGYGGFAASDLARDLADVNGPLEVHINSPGGDVWDGITIYNTLLNRNDVTVVIDGIAASIASVISCAGSTVLIAKTGTMMIHDGFTMAIGNAQDFRDAAEQLDRASNIIAGAYAERTGRPMSYWRQLMQAETWFSGQEAIDAGLVDRFADNGATRPVRQPVEEWDLSAAFRNADTGTQTKKPDASDDSSSDDDKPDDNGDGKAPKAKKANDSDQPDDDSTNYQGTQAQLLLVMLDDADLAKSVFAWDAAAAMGKCKTASDFRSICAGEHSKGEPDTAAHWALPHHNSPGAGPDKGGVVAALGRWNQTQDLKNKDAALSHLKAHARALGLPSGDSDKPSGHLQEGEWSDEDVQQFIKALRG